MKTFHELGDQSPHKLRSFKGEAENIAVDFDVLADRSSTSLSSAVWTVETGNATVGNDTESSNTTTALVTTAETGLSSIKVTATMANSEIHVALIKILCQDVEDYLVGDYWN